MPYVPSQETKDRISEALHRYHGTSPKPGKPRRQRKYVARPRQLLTWDEVRANENTRAKARRARKKAGGGVPAHKPPRPSEASKRNELNRRLKTPTKSVQGARARARSLGVPVTTRRKGSKGPQLIETGIRGRKVGWLKAKRRKPRDGLWVQLVKRGKANTVWDPRRSGG